MSSVEEMETEGEAAMSEKEFDELMTWEKKSLALRLLEACRGVEKFQAENEQLKAVATSVETEQSRWQDRFDYFYSKVAEIRMALARLEDRVDNLHTDLVAERERCAKIKLALQWARAAIEDAIGNMLELGAGEKVLAIIDEAFEAQPEEKE